MVIIHVHSPGLIDLPQTDLRVLRARHEEVSAEEAKASDITRVTRVVFVKLYLVSLLIPLCIPVDFKEADGIGGTTTHELLASRRLDTPG